ncbi:hypothetical protein FGIG_05444 [Fasciola gigantica]|uniref:Uncharacterized protein n=1 Tax=Fasciola gigantica TaxID=46835 RepID=A0A504YFC0_FASGI|nr:hypothetical protein FGIG_05444 [Fasciola gigantica]
MLSTSTSQSPSLQPKLPIPVDSRCVVVQMPSVEEMRREVADITCQMQSVYLGDEINLGPAEAATHNGGRKCSTGNKNSVFDSPNKRTVTLGSQSPLFEKSTDEEHIVSGRTKSNTIGGRMAGISNEMIEAFPIQSSMSSSLPREEQVSEEFVIDGRRYRQTYQRRVVLERKTTRDIFFLPSSSGDQKGVSSDERSPEYSSASFNKPEMEKSFAETQKSDLPGDENDSRPRLDLTVLHNPSGTGNDATCLTPAVIMRPVNNSPEKIPTNLVCNGQNTKEENGHAVVASQGMFPDGSGYNVTTSAPKPNSSPLDNTNKVKRSRSRYIVREIVEAVKKQVATNLRRTRSILTAREQQQLNKCTQHVNSATGRDEFSGSVPAILKITKAEQRSGNCGRHELVGYMYKFGVWDDQAPVLDPRLPVAIRSSVLSQEGVNGTVIANPPEWHHAEVGLNESGSGLVRGRVVACLQRFTQHSSASGKALHRSTYVQQTRLVRQRNQEPQFVAGTAGSDSTGDSLQVREEAKLNFDPTVQIRSPTASDQNTMSPEVARYVKCSNDRLQLLQSLCPAAAAATILLGRQFTTIRTSLSDNSDSELSEAEESVNLGETRFVVDATSWCPKPFLAADLTPYLVFTHADQVSDVSFAVHLGCFFQPYIMLCFFSTIELNGVNKENHLVSKGRCESSSYCFIDEA